MCVMSMVYDQFPKTLPDNWFEQWQPKTVQPDLSGQIAEMQKLLDDFRKAVEAAKVIDTFLKQPDCVDPEKAKIEERVKALEDQLAALKAALK